MLRHRTAIGSFVVTTALVGACFFADPANRLDSAFVDASSSSDAHSIDVHAPIDGSLPDSSVDDSGNKPGDAGDSSISCTGIDLSTDREHCGACTHSCFGTKCTDGPLSLIHISEPTRPY